MLLFIMKLHLLILCFVLFSLAQSQRQNYSSLYWYGNYGAGAYNTYYKFPRYYLSSFDEWKGWGHRNYWDGYWPYSNNDHYDMSYYWGRPTRLAGSCGYGGWYCA